MAYYPAQIQTLRTVYLAFCFAVMFTAFNSLQNMVAKLYDDAGYANLGQTALLFIYLALGLSTFFSSYVIRHLGYKKTMLISSLGYVVFQAAGLLVVSKVQLPKQAVWVLICIAACICGTAASFIWVAQGAYVSQLAQPTRKNEMFGLFWGIMMSSQIWGNLLGTFVLGKISNYIYFIVLIVVGSGSAILFLFLPTATPDNQSQSETATNDVSLRDEIVKIVAIIKDSKYNYLKAYFLFPGIAIVFYAGFLYKIIHRSLPKQENEAIDDYDRRINFIQGLMFISLGITQLLTGLLLNRVSQYFCKFRLATVAMLLVEIAGFVSFLAYFLNSQMLCFASAILWGSSQTLLQSNTAAIISAVFPGKVEGFSVFRIFFSIGVVSGLLAGIALSSSPDWIFLTIIMGLQIIFTAVSLQLEQLKPNNVKQGSLLDSEHDRVESHESQDSR